MFDKAFKMKDCPWRFVGEDTAGNVYWCEHCGSVFSSGDPKEIEMPMAVDRDTLYCRDQGYLV